MRLQIDDDFPCGEWEQLNAILGRYRHQYLGDTHKAHCWSRFIRAWHSVVYRYKACCEANDSFVQLWDRLSEPAMPPPEDRYAQERDLFNFVVNALSCVEAAFMAFYAMTATQHPHRPPAPLPERPPTFVPFILTTWAESVQSVFRSFEAVYPLDSFTLQLYRVKNDPERIQLEEQRNAIAHGSGSFGRYIFAGGPDWGHYLISRDMLERVRLWLAHDLGGLFPPALDFAGRVLQ